VAAVKYVSRPAAADVDLSKTAAVFDVPSCSLRLQLSAGWATFGQVDALNPLASIHVFG
jgi:hypothetical protein